MIHCIQYQPIRETFCDHRRKISITQLSPVVNVIIMTEKWIRYLTKLIIFQTTVGVVKNIKIFNYDLFCVTNVVKLVYLHNFIFPRQQSMH